MKFKLLKEVLRMNNSVSFVMPVFNEPIKVLHRSIKSVLNQVYKNFNLIIIDDNPTSISLRKFLNHISLNNNIMVLMNTKSIGAARSRNKGIRHSNSKLIAIMDADDISNNLRLKRQIKFMEKYNLDFVFSNCRDFDDKGIKSKNVDFNTKILNQSVFKYLFSHYYDCAVHSSWLVKRNVYLNLNGYRNITHGEDFDFLLRVLSHDYKVGYQPSVLVYKRQRNNGVSSSDQLKQFNISIILMKYARKFDYNKIIPLKYIYSYQNKLSKASINRFNNFLQLGHAVKYNFSIIVLFKFIFNVSTSVSSMRYLIEIIKTPIYKRKIYNMIYN